jgi:hypothetical protein
VIDDSHAWLIPDIHGSVVFSTCDVDNFYVVHDMSTNKGYMCNEIKSKAVLPASDGPIGWLIRLSIVGTISDGYMNTIRSEIIEALKQEDALDI